MHVTVFPLNLLTSQMDSPSEKTSEIKPTRIEETNGTDSLQGRQVAPDYDDIVSLHFVTNMIVIAQSILLHTGNNGCY